MMTSADAILNEGLGLMRNFLDTIQKAPELTQPGVLIAFQPQIDAWTDKAEKFVTDNPGTPVQTAGKIRAAVAMGDDIADQSPDHVSSLLYRVKQFLGSGAGPGPAVPTAANVTAKPPAAPAPAAAGGNSNLLILAVVLFLVLKS